MTYDAHNPYQSVYLEHLTKEKPSINTFIYDAVGNSPPVSPRNDETKQSPNHILQKAAIVNSFQEAAHEYKDDTDTQQLLTKKPTKPIQDFEDSLYTSEASVYSEEDGPMYTEDPFDPSAPKSNLSNQRQTKKDIPILKLNSLPQQDSYNEVEEDDDATPENSTKSIPPPPSSPVKEHVVSVTRDSNVVDWNEAFQLLLEKPTTTPEEINERNRDISDLSAKFLATATPIVMTIVRERHLRDGQKTIKPVKIGGIAGGSKYISQNIFFKFAQDTEDGMYGGREWAMKAAGHELKSINELIACTIPKVHFPLMCLINYMGCRVICISLLPINSSTLVYGSADGGRSVKNKSPTMFEIMQSFGKKLNLKEHMVKGQPVIGGADCEGHKGTDGRFYLADVSRLFPPAYVHARPQKTHGSIWFRLMRPEQVRQYKSPLSSDAFSAMGLHDREIHNQEVIDATMELETKVIPKFAVEFEEWFGESWLQSPEELHTLDLKSHLHKSGINCRYLFLLFCQVKDPELKSIIMIEIIARVCRKLLWSKMRKIKPRLPDLKPFNINDSPSSLSSDRLDIQDSDIEAVILSFLNVIFFHDSEESKIFWGSTLLEETLKRFVVSTTAEEHTRQLEYLKKSLIIDTDLENRLLLRRICALTGIEFHFIQQQKDNNNNSTVPLVRPRKKSIKKKNKHKYRRKSRSRSGSVSQSSNPETPTVDSDALAASNNNDEDDEQYQHWFSQMPLSNQIIRVAVHPTTKAIHVKPFTQSFQNIEDAIAFYKHELRGRIELLSRYHLQVAITRNHLGLLYRTKGKQHFEKAENQFLKVLEIKEKIFSPNHIEVATCLDHIASFYIQFGENTKAEQMLQRSLNIKSSTIGTENASIAKTMDQLAQLYRKLGDYDRSEPLFKKSLQILEKVLGKDDPAVANTLGNLALLYRQRGQYESAEPLYSRAVTIVEAAFGPTHSWTNKVLGNLAQLYLLQGKYAEAENLFDTCLQNQRNALGNDHIDLATTMNQLAQLHIKRCNWDAAADLFLKALAIRERVLGSGHYSVGKTLASLAELEWAQKHTDKAKEYYDRAIGILAGTLGTSHPYYEGLLKKFSELVSSS